MQTSRIGITNWGSISALGTVPEAIWQRYQSTESCIRKISHLEDWGCALQITEEEQVTNLQQQNKNYAPLDRSVLLAILAAEHATSHWERDKTFGINIGSSRGATGLWEQHFETHRSGKVSPLASPTTTLGNISTWVAHHLQAEGFALSHSVTCSTALHALLNGMVWLESGRCEKFLVGGSEAPLTPFTIAQMRALRIYANAEATAYPSRALDLEKTSNSMVLGEGAACFALEKEPKEPLAWISGVGFVNEHIETATSTSKKVFAQAMQRALQEARLEIVDAIVCHAPGTRLGDVVEFEAIEEVFGKNIPRLTSNKWKIGHTLGASGGLSLELALLMLQYNQVPEIPYLAASYGNNPERIRTVMVNAAGFGGNAVSIILQKP